MLRLAGAVTVILGSLILGEYFGMRTEFRRDQLAELELGIGFLTGDLEMRLAPVYISAETVADRLREPIKGIFADFSQRLRNGESIDRAWIRALTDRYESTFFKAEDIRSLYPLGRILQGFDTEKQQKGIDVLYGYMDRKIKELALEAAGTKRLYRSCSVLGGILAVVLLL